MACGDGNPCTADSCDPLKGCVFAPVTSACDDGSVCTVADSCAAGLCASGKALVCADGNACTLDACDTKKGCVFTFLSAPCSDGNACTTGEKCAGGACGGATALVCDDKNGCTLDVCDAGLGCVFAPTGAPCDDGSVCSVGDVCAAGTCKPGASQPCNDGNLCTDDSCQAKVGCSAVPNAKACSDGNACSTNDTCAAGACKGATLLCQDGNPCTDDFCDAFAGCKAIANATPCSDGSACTTADQCGGGKCGGKLIDCIDKNPCTLDQCDTQKGCQNPAVPAGTKCGDIGVCLGNQCSPGSDLNPATTCKQIKAALPNAPSAIYWLDPDGVGGLGAKYQGFCEMVLWGGGWLKVDNFWASKLLTVVNVVPTQGKCTMTTSEWRSWDGFDGAPGSEHLCIGQKADNNWPVYSELRFEGVQFTGYAGGSDVFDLSQDCYGVTWLGAFCAGPLQKLQPPNPTTVQLGNGKKSPVYSQQINLGAPYSDFQLRSRERGPQKEGIIWNTGAIYVR
ncbi:MAG: hypothetical protein EXR79_10720 [Myxococcales bacterium]|nr:hypothetical protein [Myxococcales bacterium]